MPYKSIYYYMMKVYTFIWHKCTFILVINTDLCIRCPIVLLSSDNQSIINHFINTKYTARIKQRKAARWFQCKDSPLNNKVENTVNTISVITSWITFNCINVKGPPFPLNPSRLAGTWHEYSARAISQENNITPYNGQLLITLVSCNFKCPYHANVMNIFETINNETA